MKKLLPLLGAVVVSIASVSSAYARGYTHDEEYRLGELAALCGLYHNDQYGLSVVRFWAKLSAPHGQKPREVLRLARGMRSAWLDETRRDRREMRRDFIACYDTIIRTLESEI